MRPRKTLRPFSVKVVEKSVSIPAPRSMAGPSFLSVALMRIVRPLLEREVVSVASRVTLRWPSVTELSVCRFW